MSAPQNTKAAGPPLRLSVETIALSLIFLKERDGRAAPGEMDLKGKEEDKLTPQKSMAKYIIQNTSRLALIFLPGITVIAHLLEVVIIRNSYCREKIKSDIPQY
jgi:hypothetical protein